MKHRRLIGVLAVSVIVLAACSSDEPTSEDAAGDGGGATGGPVTGQITIYGYEDVILPEVIGTFEEENPDVDVRVTAVPWDSAQNKYQTAVAGGTTPDIGMLGSDWMPTFRDALSPLPDELDFDEACTLL